MDALTGFLEQENTRLLVPSKASNARSKARRGIHTLEIGDGYNPDATQISKIFKRTMRAVSRLAKRAKQPADTSVTNLFVSAKPAPHTAPVYSAGVVAFVPPKALSESALDAAQQRDDDFLNHLKEKLRDQNVQQASSTHNWLEEYGILKRGLKIFEDNQNKPFEIRVEEFAIETNVPYDGEKRVLLAEPKPGYCVRIERSPTSIRGLALRVAPNKLIALSSEDICLQILRRIGSCHFNEAPRHPNNVSDTGQAAPGSLAVLAR